MRDWRKSVISPDSSILDALAAIDRGALQIALVADKRKLLGVVTDGDIRKHILGGTSLERPITEIMNSKPVVALPSEPRLDMLARMRARAIHQLPVVDHEGCIVDVATMDGLLDLSTKSNLVVLMAGGLGSRLHPLTTDTPKPMLKIGDRPILETIIVQFREYGFHRFVISMHYLAGQIKDYFGDGSALGAEITYVQESEPRGTAGALALLESRPSEPFLMMNGDLLTKLNFASLLEFHEKGEAPVTVCVRDHMVTIPYGVVTAPEGRVEAVFEKPAYRYTVNAGIYVCNPDVIDLVPRDRASTMVDLVEKLIATQQRPAIFPIHEYWVDIGQHGDFAQAGADYDRVFG